jgi:hypothetical protein
MSLKFILGDIVMVKLSHIMPLVAAATLSACSTTEEPKIQRVDIDNAVPTAAQAAEIKQQLTKFSDATVAQGNKLMAEAKEASLDGNARIFKQDDGRVVINSQPLALSGNEPFDARQTKSLTNRVFRAALGEANNFGERTPAADLKIQDYAVESFMHRRSMDGASIKPAYDTVTTVVNFGANRVCSDGLNGQDCYDIKDISPSSPLARDVRTAQAHYKTAVVYKLDM